MSFGTVSFHYSDLLLLPAAESTKPRGRLHYIKALNITGMCWRDVIPRQGNDLAIPCQFSKVFTRLPPAHFMCRGQPVKQTSLKTTEFVSQHRATTKMCGKKKKEI